MSKSRRSNLIKYISTFFAGGCIAWMYLSSRWSGTLSLGEKYCVLCDAFTIPGTLYLGLAILISLSNAGALDSISFLLSYLPRVIAPGVFGQEQKYYDFVEERREKRENRTKGYGFLYLVGGVFLGAAMVFLALFYSV